MRISAPVLLLVLSGAGPGSAVSGPEILSVAQWREDVMQTLQAIREIHPMPAKRLSELAIDEQAAALREVIPELDDHQIMVRIAEIVASLEDGHSRLTLPSRHPEVGIHDGHTRTPAPRDARLAMDRYPIELASFADGLFVIRATGEHQDLLGLRLDAIGDVGAADALERIRPAIHAENESWFRRIAADRLSIPEVLAAYEIAPVGPTSFTFSTPGGARTVTLQSLGGASGEWVAFGEDAEPMLRDQLPERPYWYRALPGRSAIYLQYRQAGFDRHHPPAEWMAGLLAEARESDVQRLVIDLRDNHGGQGMWNQPLLEGVLGHPVFDRPGGLYVLIGPETFSAAVLLLNDLEQHSHAVFVGEAAGGAPNHYGDARLVTLKHSGLTVRISTILWKNWLAGEFRDAVGPHLPVPERFENLRAGRDAALEAALSHQFPSDPIAFFREVLQLDVNAAAIFIARLAMDPALTALDLEAGLLRLGNEFLESDQLQLARYTFLVAETYYSGSAEVIAGLAGTLEKLGRPEEAIAQYRRALERDPSHPQARAGLERLEESGSE